MPSKMDVEGLEVASEQVGVSADNVRVSKPNLHFSSGSVPLSPEFIGWTGIPRGEWSVGGSKLNIRIFGSWALDSSVAIFRPY
jgi:hypothetical protein